MSTPPPDPTTSGVESRAAEVEDLLARCLEAVQAGGEGAEETLLRMAEAGLATEVRRRLRQLTDLGLWGAPAHEASHPERLGPFRMIRLLGGGGMGVVYLAEQEPYGREVAVKLVRPEHFFFPGARKRFRREIEALAQLQHPGIVPILTYGEEGGIPWFAMERIRGCTLAQALQRLRGRPVEGLKGADLARVLGSLAAAEQPSEEIPELYQGTWEATGLRIAVRIARALEHAHGRGVLHRDVKPSNILLTPDGRALLFDFGLAASEGAAELTRSGSRVGSLPYMAPEQLRGDRRRIGPRTDIYGLGASLYEILGLQMAHAIPESTTEAAARVLAPPPPSLRRLNRTLSRDAEVICRKAMERDSGRRYASAGELARDLENVLAHRPIEARPASLFLQSRRWSQRHPARAALLGAVAVLASTVFVLQARSVRQLQAAVREAEGFRLLAHSRELHVENPTLALLLAVEGARLRPGPEARSTLLSALDGSLERRAWPAEVGEIRSMTVHREAHGGRLAAAGVGGAIWLGDLEGGATIARLDSGVRHSPGTLEFSPDGSQLFFAGTRADETGLELLRLDGRTGRLLERREIPAGERSAVILAVAPSGRRVLLDEGSGGEAWLQSVADSTDRLSLGTHEMPIVAARFAPGGGLLVTGSLDGRARIWDTRTGELRHDLQHPHAVWHCDFSPDGRRLASACEDGTTYVWNLETDRPIGRLGPHRGGVFLAAFGPEGRRVLTLSQEDGTVMVWDLEDLPPPDEGTGTPMLEHPLAVLSGHEPSAEGAVFDGLGGVVTGDSAGRLRRWSLRPPTLQASLEAHHSDERGVLVAPRSELLVSWRFRDFRGFLPCIVRGLRDGARLREIGPSGQVVSAGILDLAGQRIALSTQGGWVVVFDLRSGAEAGRVDLEGATAGALAFRPGVSGEILAATGRGTLLLDSVSSTWRFLGPKRPWAVQACWSADGRQAAVAFADRGLRILDAGDGRVVLDRPDLPIGTAHPGCLAFRPDGRFLALPGPGMECVLLDVPTGEVAARLGGHQDLLTDLDFSRDGRMLLTCSRDGTARLWQVPEGSLYATIRGHERWVVAGAFLDEDEVLTCSNDGTLKRWPVDPMAAARRAMPRELTGEERRTWVDHAVSR